MRLVAHGAVLQCSQGSAPSSLVVAKTRGAAADEQGLATVLDHAPGANIQPFGLCRSLQNPQVSAATAAAQGVLTPQPCVPLTQTPWRNDVPAVVIDGVAALGETATCVCSWAGTISVHDAGSTGIDGR
jgi:hypothetical protein